MTDEKTPADKRLRRVKGALKEFPVIGEPERTRFYCSAR